MGRIGHVGDESDERLNEPPRWMEIAGDALPSLRSDDGRGNVAIVRAYYLEHQGVMLRHIMSLVLEPEYTDRQGNGCTFDRVAILNYDLRRDGTGMLKNAENDRKPDMIARYLITITRPRR